jgi:hypothetical protein
LRMLPVGPAIREIRRPLTSNREERCSHGN